MGVELGGLAREWNFESNGVDTLSHAYRFTVKCGKRVLLRFTL